MSTMTLEQARDLLASWLGGSEACLDAPKVAELSAMVSAIDAHLAQNAQGDGEVIGYLNVSRFRHENGMVNYDFDYTADLPDGNYKLYLHAERARVPDGMVLLDHEAKALHWLVELAASSWNLADNTEGNGKSLTVDADDFERMSKSLEALETLPDDKPGWTLGPAGKASWALRRVFAAEGPIAAPSQPESRS